LGRSDARRLVLVAGLALLTGCGRGGDSRLLIVTTSDVLGKTSPCGCHTPKGGLARRATFLDSVRAVRKQVLVVDAGGFFPASDDEREAGPYLLRAMSRMGTQVAGVGPNELHYGYAFVRESAHSAGVTLVCANLSHFDDGMPAFERWHVFEVAGAKVGVFGLISENADLGPARDSLRLEGAEEAARLTIRALRAHGAGVIVLLSQLGKDDGDSLTARVPGIDLLVAGGGVPALTGGVGVGEAMALYGGSQGWQVGVADVRLAGRTAGRDGARDAVRDGIRDAVRDIVARTIVLGPEVRDDPAMSASVKAFEDSLNAHLKSRAAAYGPGATPGSGADHYLGMSNCTPCHAREYAQWQTTAHARAWKTLVDQHKESTPACVPCHVTGFVSPGGFETGDDWARLGNVQCEACHGMGSHHNAWAKDGNTVAEGTCRGCHTETTSPTFRLADYRPHIVHDPPPGLRPLPETPAHRLMREGKAPHGH
jgi:hypothetical protein